MDRFKGDARLQTLREIIYTIPHPFRELALVVAAAAFFLSLVLGPSLQTTLLQPLIFGVVLAVVPLLALARSGWIALVALGIWAIGLAFALWVGTSWGFGAPDAIPPRTDWIERVVGWLLLVYSLAVAGFLAGIGQIRGGEASRDVQWIYVVFVPAALAMLLLQAITTLHGYNYPS